MNNVPHTHTEIKGMVEELIAKMTFKERVSTFFKAVKSILLSSFIFIIAASATMFFTVLSIVYTFIKYTITLKWTTGIVKFASYIYQGALSIDQTGNVTCQEVFNDTMIKKGLKKSDFMPFGNEDDTISYVLATNYYEGKLTKFGVFWCKFLDFVDPKGGGHMYKAIKNKMHSDHLAHLRYKYNSWAIKDLPRPTEV
jgi:hypothetical protein